VQQLFFFFLFQALIVSLTIQPHFGFVFTDLTIPYIMAPVEDNLVPGTVYILNESNNSEGSYGREDIILRPTPSDDPDDPLVRDLNFSRKLGILGIC
jgi:hypothetical protein